MKFYKTKSFKLFLAVIAAVIVGAIIAAATHSGTSPLSSALGALTQPLQKVSTYVGNYIDSYCDYFRSANALKEENAELKQQLVDYQQELADYEDTKRTLTVYEEFLGVKEEHPDFKFLSAEVLSRDTSDVYGSFKLDKGSAKVYHEQKDSRRRK